MRRVGSPHRLDRRSKVLGIWGIFVFRCNLPPVPGVVLVEAKRCL